MNLTQSDQALLEQLDGKLMVVRDRVKSIAFRYTTGFLLYGEGGQCKSYTVIQELERLRVDYKHHNSRMTGRGLFDVLCIYPDSVHLLEDMESLFRDTMAQGVLRSALWGQEKDGSMQRLVTWNAYETNLHFYFTGGIILTSNRPLGNLPELRALGTRLNPVHLHCTNEEIAALMRHVSHQGHRHADEVLEPAACLEVAEVIIDHCRQANRNLDMRLLIHGFKDRLQYEAGETECDWRDLVLIRLTERAVPTRRSRAEQIALEREIARQIKDLPRAERLRLWHEKTGKSEKALYRRLNEIE
jgi:hypothetical protein